MNEKDVQEMDKIISQLDDCRDRLLVIRPQLMGIIDEIARLKKKAAKYGVHRGDIDG